MDMNVYKICLQYIHIMGWLYRSLVYDLPPPPSLSEEKNKAKSIHTILTWSATLQT